MAVYKALNATTYVSKTTATVTINAEFTNKFRNVCASSIFEGVPLSAIGISTSNGADTISISGNNYVQVSYSETKLVDSVVDTSGVTVYGTRCATFGTVVGTGAYGYEREFAYVAGTLTVVKISSDGVYATSSYHVSEGTAKLSNVIDADGRSCVYVTVPKLSDDLILSISFAPDETEDN